MHVIISGNKNVVKVNFDKEGLDYVKNFNQFGKAETPYERRYNRVISYEEALEDVLAWLVKEQVIANNKSHCNVECIRSLVEGCMVFKLKLYSGVKRYLSDFELNDIEDELSPSMDFTLEDIDIIVNDVIRYFVFGELFKIEAGEVSE